jgi:hypothetical protein
MTSGTQNGNGALAFVRPGVDRKGHPVLIRRVRREQLLKVLGELEPCLIGIEASTGAFYWQRQFEKLAHAVKISPAIREAIRPPAKERQQ